MPDRAPSDADPIDGTSAPRQDPARMFDAVTRVNALLASELDPDRLVQSVVDAGRELTGAAYAAFFYTPVEGEVGRNAGMLYALSGAPREAFDRFPPLQLTPLFHATFEASETVRSDDVLLDARYGKQAPHGGMPEGHLPVRSYLAVPVKAPEGHSLGALLFGHPAPGVFDDTAERGAAALADQAAIALQNARVYASLRAELVERRRSTMALRQSEQQFRQIADALPQLVWTTTPEGYHDYFNERWYAFTGMPRPNEEGGENRGGSQGFRWADYLHPDDLERTSARWAHSLATGEPYEIEYRFRRASDGAYRWFIARANALHDASGQIVRWFGTCTDVHEQKQTEEDLRAREHEFSMLANAIPQLAWMADAEGHLFWYNQRWYDYTGTTLGEVVGDGWRRVHDPAHVDGVAERFAASVLAGTPWEDTFPLRRHDGVFRWFLSRAQPIRDGEGRIERWIGTNTDVTDQRELLAERDEAVESLRQSRDRHRLALEGGGMGTWEWDIPADRLIGDERIYRLWGAKPGAIESVAAFYARLVHPDDLPGLQASVGAALEGGDDYEHDFRIVRPDGRVRWMANRGRVIRNKAGAPTRMYGLSYDVTERREDEEAMLRKTREMEQFTYTISHDLKSPLVTITGFLGILEGHLKAGRVEPAQAAAERVRKAASRMSQLIEDLLHLSWAGRVVGDPAPVDLDALAADLADAFGPRVAAAGGTVRVEGALGRVLADGQRLGEVVDNLLSNAVRYGLGGGGTQIVIRAEHVGDGSLRLIVEDDGPGVPAPYRDKVFHLFQRLDAQASGTGIGLAVVARVMEVVGGRAVVESAGGPDGREGARFVLEFPREAVLDTGHGNATDASRVGST